MILTAREIKDLAEYALGVTIVHGLPEDDDLDDHEFTISKCPEDGVLDESTNTITKSNYVVTCDGCDGNECLPIGVQREEKRT